MADDTSTLSRRHFLRASAVGATAVGVGALTAAEPQHVSAASVRGRRPNVLYVFSDQHRASAMGCYGDPNVRTPVFDAFAKQGAQFNAGMSSTPVCCPHRACLLTGQYSHHNGMVSNSVEWAPNQPCVADLFGAAGYRTGYIGKWHLNSPKAEGAKGGYVAKERRFGFDWWRMSSAGHKYYDYNYFVDDAREPTKTDVYQPTMMANQAIEFIGEKSKGEAPWLLYLSWGPPHTPYEAPPEFPYRVVERVYEYVVGASAPSAHYPAALGTLALLATHPGPALMTFTRMFKKAVVAGESEEAALKKVVAACLPTIQKTIDSVLASDLPELVEMHSGRGLLEGALNHMSGLYRSALERRRKEPLFDLDWVFPRAMAGGMQAHQTTFPPCDVLQERNDQGDFPRDALYSFDPPPPDEFGHRPTDYTRSFQAQQEFLYAHVDFTSGAFIDSASADSRCPFFSACQQQFRADNPEICGERPWESYGGAGHGCWYSTAVAASLGPVQIKKVGDTG